MSLLVSKAGELCRRPMMSKIFFLVGLASIGGHACVLHPSLSNLLSVAATFFGAAAPQTPKQHPRPLRPPCTRAPATPPTPVGVGPGELEALLLRVALARVGTRLRRPLSGTRQSKGKGDASGVTVCPL